MGEISVPMTSALGYSSAKSLPTTCQRRSVSAVYIEPYIAHTPVALSEISLATMAIRR
jgi:hypothetical protein